MNIDEMPAGPEMNSLVAERVMGLVPCLDECHNEGYPWHVPRPCHAMPDNPTHGNKTECYSTNIAAAWLVVEKLASMGILFAMGNGFQRDNQSVWVFNILQGAGDAGIITDAPTVPLAICRAALKAVSVTA